MEKAKCSRCNEIADIEASTERWQFCAPCYQEYSLELASYRTQCEHCEDSGYDISDGQYCDQCDAGKEQKHAAIAEGHNSTIGNDPRVIRI